MKPIAIPRPTDPEMRQQWDEAKRACELRDVVDAAAERFDALPLHRASIEARAELADDDCCVGDRSQCRCAPERGGWSDEDVEREKWLQVWSDSEEQT